MADNFGLTFAPTDQNTTQNPNGPPSGGRPSQAIQDAIQILSLRIPRVVGAGSITSPSLLGPSGAPDPILDMLRRLFPTTGTGTYQPPHLPRMPLGTGPTPSQPAAPIPHPGFVPGNAPPDRTPVPVTSPPPPAATPGPRNPFPNPMIQRGGHEFV